MATDNADCVPARCFKSAQLGSRGGHCVILLFNINESFVCFSALSGGVGLQSRYQPKTGNPFSAGEDIDAEVDSADVNRGATYGIREARLEKSLVIGR